jgi:hypothetical protein
MVLYEVNLTVNKEIQTEYLAWMPGHLQDMLQFDGFNKANFWEELPMDPTASPTATRHFVAQFEITNYDYLQNYFKHHATRMRQEAIDKFGNKFSANRRVLKLVTFKEF